MTPHEVTDNGRVNEDLREIYESSNEQLRALNDADVLIFGATGFVGTWLSITLAQSMSMSNSKGRLFLLSRGGKFYEYPNVRVNINNSRVKHIQVDVTQFAIEKLPRVDFVINAATPARASLNAIHPKQMIDVITQGQRNILEFCIRNEVKKCLFLSSGAIYGQQYNSNKKVSEDDLISPSTLVASNAYAEAKRMAEIESAIAVAMSGVGCSIARLFAFLAPFLPLNEHFAAGNFIETALNSQQVNIRTEGKSIRSYQYATDMVHWLLKILLDGEPGRAYNVGSSEEISIRHLAQRIALLAGDLPVISEELQESPTWYVPDVSRAFHELGLYNQVSLDEAIVRTMRAARGG